MGPLKLSVAIERIPLVPPFQITGRTWETLDVLITTLERDGVAGRSEAAGVYYKNDTADLMLSQIGSLRARIEAGIETEDLQTLLPRGGARNGLDCALWDLKAKLSN